MQEVESWYRIVAKQLDGLYFKDSGPMLAIQLEKEMPEDAEYLKKLKELAIKCGMEVPLYTVTGWNSTGGAKIPVDEVLPLFGGYCGAPWEQSTEELPPSTHYFFTGIRGGLQNTCTEGIRCRAWISMRWLSVVSGRVSIFWDITCTMAVRTGWENYPPFRNRGLRAIPTTARCCPMISRRRFLSTGKCGNSTGFWNLLHLFLKDYGECFYEDDL